MHGRQHAETIRMAKGFEDTYRSAIYRVQTAGQAVTFRIDEPSEILAAAIAARKAPGAAFITAWNPGSSVLPEAENWNRQIQLENALHILHAFYVLGEGKLGEWREEHYLVIGITREMAEALGRRFDQNAILWIEPDGTPRLVMLTPRA